jgi:hypothetical protein
MIRRQVKRSVGNRVTGRRRIPNPQHLVGHSVRNGQQARSVIEFIGAMLVLLSVMCGLHACGSGNDLVFPGDVTTMLTLTAAVATFTPTP